MSLERLTSTLRQLRPGDKAWFWISAVPLAEAPMLLMTAFQQEAPLQQLNHQVAQLAIPAGTPVAMGLVFVDEEGRVSLGAPGLSPSVLINLARWVSDHVAQHPDLAILRDTTLVTLDAQGVVRSRHHDSALWQDVPRRPPWREIDRSVVTLKALTKSGRRAWFWAADLGLGGVPILVMRPLRSGSDTARFSALAREHQQQCRPGARTIQGSVVRSGRGRLLFTAANGISHAQAVFRRLVEHHPHLADAIAGAMAIQLGESGAGKPIPLCRMPTVTERHLTALNKDTELLFWFTDQSHTGAPCLLVDSSSDRLKTAARAQQGEGRSLRGSLSLHEAGWCHFQTAQDAPWFLGALHAWSLQTTGSAVEKLRGARLSCRTADHKLIARYRDDVLWKRTEPQGG